MNTSDLFAFCSQLKYKKFVFDNSQTATYNSIESLLAAWKSFVGTNGWSEYQNGYTTINGEKVLNKNFTFVHGGSYNANGIYSIRYAGEQYGTVTDEDGEVSEVLLGYVIDIARDGADENYTVSVAKINTYSKKLCAPKGVQGIFRCICTVA